MRARACFEAGKVPLKEEFAGKRVVNMRLKGPGIFWKEEIADAMLLLRSYYKAGRWNLLKNMVFIGVLGAN